LREECIVRMYGRKELRRIFGAARDELRKAGEN
jgi:hypothetical protein